MGGRGVGLCPTKLNWEGRERDRHDTVNSSSITSSRLDGSRREAFLAHLNNFTGDLKHQIQGDV